MTPRAFARVIRRYSRKIVKYARSHIRGTYFPSTEKTCPVVPESGTGGARTAPPRNPSPPHTRSAQTMPQPKPKMPCSGPPGRPVDRRKPTMTRSSLPALAFAITCSQELRAWQGEIAFAPSILPERQGHSPSSNLALRKCVLQQKRPYAVAACLCLTPESSKSTRHSQRCRLRGWPKRARPRSGSTPAGERSHWTTHSTAVVHV